MPCPTYRCGHDTRTTTTTSHKGVTVEVYDDVASGGSFIELRDGAKVAFTYEGTQMRIDAVDVIGTLM